MKRGLKLALYALGLWVAYGFGFHAGVQAALGVMWQ